MAQHSRMGRMFLCSLVLLGVIRVACAGEPQERVRETVDAVLAVLSDKGLQAPERAQERRAKMRQAVFQRFGFKEMAQRALGPHWGKRNPAEKKEFVGLFSDLLERAYINKIESYSGDQKVQYAKETVDKDGFATVVTTVVTKHSGNVDVEYRLLQRDKSWQVYDIVIEGVSLVNNYRTQFNNVISQESYEALVKKLKLKQEQEQSIAPSKG